VYKNNEPVVLNSNFTLTCNGLSIQNYLTTTNNRVSFDVNSFFSSASASERDGEINTFVFSLFEEEEEESVIRATKPFLGRFGLTSDMATFNVHATGFNAAFRNKKLTFGDDGLTVYNGGIRIMKTGETNPVFESDTNGNLKITGVLTAKAGGRIGGFYIDEGKLTSTVGNIVLDGSNGEIEADSIKIGMHAKITDYIEFPIEGDQNGNLASSYIYNPNKHSGLWLSANDIKLYRDGTFKLGDIEYDPNYSPAPALFSKNKKWVIESSGRAIFEDIYANNCHIENSSLQADSIQSAGNLTIFAESWTITDVVTAKSFKVDVD
jgi:hypothetical protein